MGAVSICPTLIFNYYRYSEIITELLLNLSSQEIIVVLEINYSYWIIQYNILYNNILELTRK